MTSTQKPASLIGLFISMTKISATTLGGGFVMLPLMRRELVEHKQWVCDEVVMDAYALGQSIPGVIAMNTATLIGYRKRGFLGAIVSAAGMALPSVVIILLVARFLTPYFHTPWVAKAFAGIRAAVVALILKAIWQMGRKSITSKTKAALAVVSFLAIIGLQMSPALLLIAGATLGCFLFRKEVPS